MNGKQGKLIIISAPSGAGKGTVISRILEMRPDLTMSVSATTRAPREGEKDGVSYHFVSHEQFNDMIKRDEFFEYAEYIGDYYGTPKKPVYDCIRQGKDILLEIEVNGAKQVMDQTPDAISIFIVCPDIRELERRLRGRGTDSEEKLAARLEKARAELECRKDYAHVVVNDDVTRAAKEILSIIYEGKE